MISTSANRTDDNDDDARSSLPPMYTQHRTFKVVVKTVVIGWARMDNWGWKGLWHAWIEGFVIIESAGQNDSFLFANIDTQFAL
uniref:Uncharacterized protein n=1 Tax=Panagrellus redivivus TaxID=6233 RepID=A0A7E4ZU91_PANRE